VRKVFCATASLVVAFMAYAMVATPALGRAADLDVTPAVVRTQKVAWIQVQLPETTARKVRIEVHTPKVNGERRLWQACDMEYVGLGTYRCGVDVSGKTPARSMDGKWLGKVKLDGRGAGSMNFRTSSR
jgi:hypothetical protein